VAVGEGRISRGSATPRPQGGQHSPILGVPSIYASTVCHRTTKFDVVTWERGVYLGVSHASHAKREKFQSSPIFGVLYLCMHPLMQNDQILHCQPRRCIFAQVHCAVCQQQLSFLLIVGPFVSLHPVAFVSSLRVE